MADFLASDWFSWLLTGSVTAARGLLRGSRAHRKSRGLGWETADQG